MTLRGERETEGFTPVFLPLGGLSEESEHILNQKAAKAVLRRQGPNCASPAHTSFPRGQKCCRQPPVRFQQTKPIR